MARLLSDAELEQKYSDDDVVLRHSLAERLFHYGLIAGFLPTAVTGIIMWLRPFGAEGMHLAMQIHIVGAIVLTVSCSLFHIICYKKIVYFWRTITDWNKDDIGWLLVCGGYAHKFLKLPMPYVPLMGKMNSGQKLLGLMTFYGMFFIVLTGWLLYGFLPMIPKGVAVVLDYVHLYLGLFMTVGVCCGHITLALYNWNECVCMFGNGTMKVSEAKGHNALWVENEIEPYVKK
jgi:formate dehydrogenase subunit gamma